MELRSPILLLLLLVVVVAVAASEQKPPIGAWILDDVFRGLNLGSGGADLKLQDHLQKVREFRDLGPRPFPHLKYMYFHGSSITSENPWIPNRYNNTPAFDFWKPFTIAVWVKFDNKNEYSRLLTGSSGHGISGFIVFDRESNDKIYVLGKHLRKTINNRRNMLDWRHVAVTFDGGDNYSIYLNGSEWPIWNEGSGMARSVPTKLDIGVKFKGSMACLMLFDRALSQKEVQKRQRQCS